MQNDNLTVKNYSGIATFVVNNTYYFARCPRCLNYLTFQGHALYCLNCKSNFDPDLYAKDVTIFEDKTSVITPTNLKAYVGIILSINFLKGMHALPFPIAEFLLNEYFSICRILSINKLTREIYGKLSHTFPSQLEELQKSPYFELTQYICDPAHVQKCLDFLLELEKEKNNLQVQEFLANLAHFLDFEAKIIIGFFEHLYFNLSGGFA